MNSPEASVVPTGAPPVPTGLAANPDNTVIHLGVEPVHWRTGYNVNRSLDQRKQLSGRGHQLAFGQLR